MQEKIFLNHKLKRYGNKEQYLIDTQLRAFLLEILEHIENALKQAFINEIGENYNNIDFYRDTFKEEVDLFIKEKTEYLKNKDEECENINGKINVNIFISKLTFGEVLHLFRKLNTNYKKNINSNYFGFYKIKIFEDWVNNMRYLRNLVCHGENIFNRIFLKKILIYNYEFKKDSFKGYISVLGVFCKILGIENKYNNILEFLKNKKNVPGVKHISEEIEAWYVLVSSLYKFYVKKSNLNGGNVDIIQFLPYFPPHKGGLETHSQEFGIYWKKNNLGKVYNIITEIPYPNPILIGEGIKGVEKIIFENEIIGYKKDGVENLVCPSLEIINNFPVYKFWDKKYKLIIKYLKNSFNFSLEERNSMSEIIIITRTRFFLTSLIGGFFARRPHPNPLLREERGQQGIKWIHIEHGSGYVKLNSSFKNLIAKIYDKLIGKWIFKKADILVGVSNACKKFIQKEFVNREVEVIYRGLDLPKIENRNFLKNKFKGKIIIGFIGRLFKWKNVETLIKAFYNLDKKLKEKIQIVIVGDGEDFERLKKLDKENKIYFTGGKSFKEALELQNQFDIHFHTSSPGGGLATTLIQAMGLEKFIISTPYEGANEVIKNLENGILLENDSLKEIKKGLEMGLEIFEEKKEIFGKNARKVFKEKFNWDENILKYYKLFNEK